LPDEKQARVFEAELPVELMNVIEKLRNKEVRSEK
jgi:hypothetical protein